MLVCCYLRTSSLSRGIVVTRKPRALVATDRAYGRKELRVEVTADKKLWTEVSAKGKLWWLRPKQSLEEHQRLIYMAVVLSLRGKQA